MMWWPGVGSAPRDKEEGFLHRAVDPRRGSFHPSSSEGGFEQFGEKGRRFGRALEDSSRGRLWVLLRAGDGGSGTGGCFETLHSGLWGGKIADAMLAEEECWRKLSRGLPCRACGLRSVLHLPSIRSSGGWEGYV